MGRKNWKDGDLMYCNHTLITDPKNKAPENKAPKNKRKDLVCTKCGKHFRKI